MGPIKSQEFRSSLAPAVFLERIKEATVPFEELMNFQKPMKSYVNLVVESFVGDKTIVAHIAGNEARLTPIGFWPFKGNSLLANCGYLSCRVDPAESGSLIRSSYQLAWIYKIAIPVFLTFACLMVIAIAALVRYGATLDGRWMLVGSAAFAIFLSVGFPLYYLRGAKTQSRLTSEFLAKFVAENG